MERSRRPTATGVDDHGAWASLLKDEGNMRVLFALFAVMTLAIGVVAYLGVPAVIA